MSDEKTVTVHIPADALAGFCWDETDYYPGDEFQLPERQSKICEMQGRVVIGPKPAGAPAAPPKAK